MKLQFTVERKHSNHPDFILLITLLDEELRPVYKHVDFDYDTHNQVGSETEAVVIYKDQLPIACGCFRKIDNDKVEIKRMFVKPEFRGQGVSRIVLKELEAWATEMNYKNAVLETGSKQSAAIALYQKQGYKIIPNYGDYKGNEQSICFEKILEA